MDTREDNIKKFNEDFEKEIEYINFLSQKKGEEKKEKETDIRNSVGWQWAHAKSDLEKEFIKKAFYDSCGISEEQIHNYIKLKEVDKDGN